MTLRDSGGSQLSAPYSICRRRKIRSVNLNWEPLGVHYRSSGIALLRVLVKEEQMELRVKLPGCVRTLDRLLATGHTLYLHRTAGVGRSPTIAIAYLHSFL